VVDLVSDAFARPGSEGHDDATDEIRKALTEADDEAARGELLTVDEAFAGLRRNAEERRRRRSRTSQSA
jgi:hypothetical protein